MLERLLLVLGLILLQQLAVLTRPTRKRPQLWAAKRFTVQRLTFRMLYVLLIITTGGASWSMSA
jgi:hypothetical protein